jgi:hypothetical protein
MSKRAVALRMRAGMPLGQKLLLAVSEERCMLLGISRTMQAITVKVPVFQVVYEART